MDHKEVTGLIKKVRRSYYRETAKINFIRGNVAADEAVKLDPGRRLFVGFSRGTKDDYRLELRVQREGSLAHEAALEFKKQAKGEANIMVVQRIAVPSVPAALDTKASDDEGLGRAKRPLHIGVSVGHKNSGPGTLGAFVGTSQGDGILSNCHVLGLSGRIDPGDDKAPHYIYQPGKPDIEYLTSDERVAVLHKLSDISNDSANTVDAAVAVLKDGIQHLGNIIPPDTGWPRAGERLSKEVGSVRKLLRGAKVAKIGRTTGYTTGQVSAVATDAIVDIPGLGNAYFEDLLEVTAPADQPYSSPGDSGSLVFEEDTLTPVGLHFAGGTVEGMNVGYACSLERVLKALRVTLLP